MNTEESHEAVGLVTIFHAVPFQRSIAPTEPTAQPSLPLTMNTEERSRVVGLAQFKDIAFTFAIGKIMHSKIRNSNKPVFLTTFFSI
ncbi:hypothetical protein MUP01_11380 [Candidatus Bathyarchaeota archaeon]|nr:hypothetical protein [Candidatus Bathyarchaeota archaeon]